MAATVIRYRSFIEREEDLPTKASLNISFFLNEIYCTDQEFLRRSVDWAKKQSGWNCQLFVDAFLINFEATKNESQFIRLAIVLNDAFDQTFGPLMTFCVVKHFDKIIFRRYPEEKHDKLVAFARLASECYKQCWLSDENMVGLLGPFVLMKHKLSFKKDLLKALIEPSIAELRCKDLNNRLLFGLNHLELKNKRLTSVPKRERFVLAANDVQAFYDLMISTGFSNREEILHNKAEELFIITNGYDGDLEKFLRQLNSLDLRHIEQFNFIIGLVFDKGVIATAERQQQLVALHSHLTTQTFHEHKEANDKYFIEMIQEKTDGLLICKMNKTNEALVLPKLNYMSWIACLYNASLITDEVIEEIFEKMIKLEKSQKFILCLITTLMEKVGKKLTERKPELVAEYFKSFKNLAKNDKTSFRRQKYAKLIEYRESGWLEKSPKNNTGSSLKYEAKMRERFADEQLYTGVFDELIIVSPNFSFDNLADEKKLTEVAKQLLSKKIGVKTVFNFVLNQPTANLSNILLSLKLLLKTREIFKGNNIAVDTQINKSLKNEISLINNLELLDEDARIRFIRLTVISGGLFQRKTLSNEKISDLLLSKHVHQIPIDALTHLSSIIYPRIRSDKSEPVKLALIFLESLIANLTKTFYADVGKILKELIEETELFQETNQEPSIE